MLNGLVALGLLAHVLDRGKREEAEEKRLSRVVRRVLYCNGTLSEYSAPDLRGVVEANMNSDSSDAIPPFYDHGRWDRDEFKRQRAYPWPEAMHKNGLVRLHTWAERAEFKGVIRSAAWFPDFLTETAAEYPPKLLNYGNVHMHTNLKPGQCGRELMVAVIDCETHAQVAQLQRGFGPIHPRQDAPGIPHDMRRFDMIVFMADFHRKHGFHGFLDTKTMKVSVCEKARMREHLETGRVRGVEKGESWITDAQDDAALFREAANRGILPFSQDGEGMCITKENGNLRCLVMNENQEILMRRFAAWMHFDYAEMDLDLSLEGPYT